MGIIQSQIREDYYNIQNPLNFSWAMESKLAGHGAIATSNDIEFIETIRNKRPGSIETPEQEQAVQDYFENLKK